MLEPITSCPPRGVAYSYLIQTLQYFIMTSEVLYKPNFKLLPGISFLRHQGHDGANS